MDISERRHYPRIKIDYVTVEVYPSEIESRSTEIEEICPVVNISENGMCFRAEHSFSNSQILRITFVLPDSIVIIRTDAIVVHISKHDKNTNDFGVQFKNLGIAEQILIRHFINKNLQTYS
jgi:hypothetical protein